SGGSACNHCARATSSERVASGSAAIRDSSACGNTAIAAPAIASTSTAHPATRRRSARIAGLPRRCIAAFEQARRVPGLETQVADQRCIGGGRKLLEVGVRQQRQVWILRQFRRRRGRLVGG